MFSGLWFGYQVLVPGVWTSLQPVPAPTHLLHHIPRHLGEEGWHFFLMSLCIWGDEGFNNRNSFAWLFTICATSPSCGSWPQLQGSSFMGQLGAHSPSVQTARRRAWTAPGLRLAEGMCSTQVNARCLQGRCWLPCTSLSPCQKIIAATVREKKKAVEAVVL